MQKIATKNKTLVVTKFGSKYERKKKLVKIFLATCYKTYHMNLMIFIFYLYFFCQKWNHCGKSNGQISCYWHFMICLICHLGLVGLKGSIGTIYNPSLFFVFSHWLFRNIVSNPNYAAPFEGFLIVQIVSCALLNWCLTLLKLTKSHMKTCTQIKTYSLAIVGIKSS